MPVPPRATAGIVAKRATGLRTIGNQGGDKEGQAPKWFKSQDKAKQTQETNIYNDFAFTGADTCAAAISASDWLADSAATTHIARNRSHFTDYISKPNEIQGISLGSPLKTIRRGTIK